MPAITLPRPLQPPTTHLIGFDSGAVYEYTVSEYLGKKGRPLIVVSAGRPGSAIPFAWFSRRVVAAITETYGPASQILVVESRGAEQQWAVVHTIKVPDLNVDDPGVRKKLDRIHAAATGAGQDPQDALMKAIERKEFGDVGYKTRRELFDVTPEEIAELMRHHVEPAAPARLKIFGETAPPRGTELSN